jgi:23S rRNA (adenine2503-C2)-methyltransferase
MGEPLHNIDNVIKAADIMVDDQGLHFSPRKVTVSTSGLVPQLRRFLQESKCTIAVSLNATTDEVIIISLMLFVGTEVVMKRQEQ